MIIKYWLKIILCGENKYIKCIYNMMIQDMNRVPGRENWAALVNHSLRSLGFNEVWLAQGVGNENMFLNLVRQR